MTAALSSTAQLAIIAIGRNEGERLRKCLQSAKAAGPEAVVVYVDSGSTDQSVALAIALGCEVVPLDLSIPFTAARARNEGFASAMRLAPGLRYVQLVDGDCEIAADWVATARAFLDTQDTVAAVCGRRRERYPQASIYNQLCDLEWNTPVGKVRSCGGDVMLRVQALQQAGGYRASLIAGEEPELCVRMRAHGWLVWRLDAEMTLHDAAMTRLGQWWNRSKRAGHAFAEGAALHGAYPEKHNVRETTSALLWGACLPLLLLVLACWQPAVLLTFLIYPLQVVRLARSSALRGSIAWWRAGFLVLGKFPEAQGVLSYWLHRALRQSSTLIEYK